MTDSCGGVQTVEDIDPDVPPSNIDAFSAVECTQAGAHSFCVNEDAPKNIERMSTTFDTSHREISLLNDFAFLNILKMLTRRDTSHAEISALNDRAWKNMRLMSCTFDTSHFERSLLNDSA